VTLHILERGGQLLNYNGTCLRTHCGIAYWWEISSVGVRTERKPRANNSHFRGEIDVLLRGY
jgi:hypothetical protein